MNKDLIKSKIPVLIKILKISGWIVFIIMFILAVIVFGSFVAVTLGWWR